MAYQAIGVGIVNNKGKFFSAQSSLIMGQFFLKFALNN